MQTPKQMCIGMALAPSWLSRNGWRRADSDVEDLFSIQHYIDLAQRAEAAKLDFVFKPDTLFLMREFVAREPGFSSLDPFVLLAAIAPHTRKIGLVATASTTLSQPYTIARQLQSLNWVTHERVGWNIVTAIDGQKNFGEEQLLPSEQRYEKAAEFVDVVEKLWESYPNQSLIRDRDSGIFADIAQINPIHHQGAHFAVEGPLNLPAPSPERLPYFQAGASESGRQFAAEHADAIFAATPDISASIALRQDIRHRATRVGRDPNAVKVLPGLNLYLAGTRTEAQQLFQETLAGQDPTRGLNYVKQAIGLDLSKLPPHTRITREMLPEVTSPVRSQTHTDLLYRLIERDTPTASELLHSPEVMGSSHWLVVGTVEDAFESVTRWFQAGAMDGFIAVPSGSLHSLTLFFEQLMPMLAHQGWFRKEYQGTTLRDHLQLNLTEPSST